MRARRRLVRGTRPNTGNPPAAYRLCLRRLRGRHDQYPGGFGISYERNFGNVTYNSVFNSSGDRPASTTSRLARKGGGERPVSPTTLWVH